MNVTSSSASEQKSISHFLSSSMSRQDSTWMWPGMLILDSRVLRKWVDWLALMSECEGWGPWTCCLCRSLGTPLMPASLSFASMPPSINFHRGLIQESLTTIWWGSHWGWEDRGTTKQPRQLFHGHVMHLIWIWACPHNFTILHWVPMPCN